MAQISKRILRRKVEERIFEIFLKSLGKIKNDRQAAGFVEDLLSPTERTMLAKRMSIAFLLSRGYDQRAICRVLRVSLGTVSKVSLKLKQKGGGYRWVIGQIGKEEEIRKVLEDMESLFTALPPKGGNWSRWRKRKIEKERSRSKAF